MLALIERKCVLDVKGALMVGKHIYFPPDSALCTSSAKKAAEGAVPASGHIKNPRLIFRFQVQGQFD